MNSNLKSISRSLSSGLKSVEARASSLATDKNVLYIMLVIAVVNVVGYLMMGNFEAVVFFAIVAYLSTFFTKNMVVVFWCPFWRPISSWCLKSTILAE